MGYIGLPASVTSATSDPQAMTNEGVPIMSKWTKAPDGTYVGGSEWTMAPDGTYVGGSEWTMAPDGTYVGGSDWAMAPDGTYVGVD